MISKTSTVHNDFYSTTHSSQLKKGNNVNIEYDDEYVNQNLKKANFSVSNNFQKVVNKFKSSFLNN